jgi:hypothetical protein
MPDTNQVPENRKWFQRFIKQLLTGLALLGGAIALVQYGVTLGKSESIPFFVEIVKPPLP